MQKNTRGTRIARRSILRRCQRIIDYDDEIDVSRKGGNEKKI